MDGFNKEAMEAAVLRGLKNMGNMTEGGSFYDDAQGFLHAIDWSEPWLKGKKHTHKGSPPTTRD